MNFDRQNSSDYVDGSTISTEEHEMQPQETIEHKIIDDVKQSENYRTFGRQFQQENNLLFNQENILLEATCESQECDSFYSSNSLCSEEMVEDNEEQDSDVIYEGQTYRDVLINLDNIKLEGDELEEKEDELEEKEEELEEEDELEEDQQMHFGQEYEDFGDENVQYEIKTESPSDSCSIISNSQESTQYGDGWNQNTNEFSTDMLVGPNNMPQNSDLVIGNQSDIDILNIFNQIKMTLQSLERDVSQVIQESLMLVLQAVTNNQSNEIFDINSNQIDSNEQEFDSALQNNAFDGDVDGNSQSDDNEEEW